MANHYSCGSLAIKLDTKEQCDYLVKLLTMRDFDELLELVPEFKEDDDGYRDWLPSHDLVESDEIKAHNGDDSEFVVCVGDHESIDGWFISVCVRHVLKKYDLPYICGFSIAQYCSRLRTGEFGGIVYIVNKEHILSLDTIAITDHTPEYVINQLRHFSDTYEQMLEECRGGDKTKPIPNIAIIPETSTVLQ